MHTSCLEENMKKFTLVLTVLAICVSFAFAQAKAEAAPAEQGKVFNIYCWNNEFQVRFEKYFQEAGLIPEGVTVNWVVTPNQGMNYQDKLDEALLSQDNKSADEKVDMFLVEADYALKYVDSPYALAVVNDIGLT